jgi:hypothetical protein
MQNFKNLNMMPFFQEYEQQLKAYGIPIQSFDWKQIPTTTTANVLVKISLNFFALRRNKLECLSLASPNWHSSLLQTIYKCVKAFQIPTLYLILPEPE